MGVLKSTDNGQTWTCSELTTDYGTTYAVAVDPTDSDIIYAGGEYNPSGYRPALFKTTNGGTQWNNITGSITGYVYDLKFDPANSSRLFMGTADGIYRSTNAGSSWTKVSNYFSVKTIVFDPVNPNLAYAGTSQGVYISENGGNSWDSMNDGLPVTEITALHLDHVNGILYAGTQNNSTFLYRLSTAVEASGKKPEMPSDFVLHQNHPNPFNNLTKIRIDIARPAHLRVKIVDISGRLVKMILDDDVQPGVKELIWDGTNGRNQNMPSGVYLIQLKSDHHIQTRKIILKK